MRAFTSSLILALVIIGTVSKAADISPADTNTPLFRIFAPIPMKRVTSAIGTQLTFDNKRPLLVVHSVSDLRLARDNKSVLITLTRADAKKFAEMTQKYNQGLLLFEAEGRVLEAMQITTPVVDGVLGFKYPDQAAVAEYLRRRFRIGEFR